MKILKTDINNAIARTPASFDGKDIRAMNGMLLGHYSPKDANWSWELHAISFNNNPMIVASRFGRIYAEGE